MSKTLAEWRKEAAERFDAFSRQRDARKEKDELELFEKLGPAFKLEYIVVECRDAAPELPQFVVFHRPSGPQTDRFKTQMWKDSKERGVVEAKARAGADLAVQCLAWPSIEEYTKLIDANRMLPDKVAGILVEEAQAGAEAAGKG